MLEPLASPAVMEETPLRETSRSPSSQFRERVVSPLPPRRSLRSMAMKSHQEVIELSSDSDDEPYHPDTRRRGRKYADSCHRSIQFKLSPVTDGGHLQYHLVLLRRRHRHPRMASRLCLIFQTSAPDVQELKRKHGILQVFYSTDDNVLL